MLLSILQQHNCYTSAIPFIIVITPATEDAPHCTSSTVQWHNWSWAQVKYIFSHKSPVHQSSPPVQSTGPVQWLYTLLNHAAAVCTTVLLVQCGVSCGMSLTTDGIAAVLNSSCCFWSFDAAVGPTTGVLLKYSGSRTNSGCVAKDSSNHKY